MKQLFLIAALLFITALLYGCAGGKAGAIPETLNVSAAASLKDVLMELQVIYEKENPGVKLRYNFASSGTLQHQLEQGAPADLFLSAGKKQMDALLEQGLVGEPVVVAGNRLVLVIPADHTLTGINMEDLWEPGFAKIAIGNPETVPAGKYAEEALRKTGLLEKLSAKLVYAKDVRQVLAYIETGNVDGGFVYQSDTTVTAKVRTVLTVPEDLHTEILYPGAIVKSNGQREQAEGFLRFLVTKEAGEIFKKYGFTAPSK